MGEVKIRFGVSLGNKVEDLPGVIDRLESAGVDSLWFSELVYTSAVDPFAGMALGSFLTADEAQLARKTIERAAAEAGRAIEPDHYGLSLGVADGGLRDEIAAAIRTRRPDVDPAELVAGDWSQLHRQLDGLIAAGLSKFVVRPVGDTPSDEFIDRFISELLPRQN